MFGSGMLLWKTAVVGFRLRMMMVQVFYSHSQVFVLAGARLVICLRSGGVKMDLFSSHVLFSKFCKCVRDLFHLGCRLMVTAHLKIV